ncbi:MAG: hypothetical protein Q9171_002792 [Xanthocarpia ochracea]
MASTLTPEDIAYQQAHIHEDKGPMIVDTGYKILEVGFYLSITYTLAHWFIKMSILLFYIRIFTLRVKWFKIAIYATMTYISCWAVSLLFIIFLQCRPISYFWLRFDTFAQTPAVGKCTVDADVSAISTSVLNTVADFAVLIFPIVVLAGMQLKLRKKIALLSIFLVGCFACVAGILRFVSTIATIGNGTDTTYSTAPTFIWTAIEAAVGLMCACFPIIGPIFSLTLEKLRSSSKSSRYLGYLGSSKNSHGSSWRRVGGANEGVDADIMPSKKVLAQQQRGFGFWSSKQPPITTTGWDDALEMNSQNRNSRNDLKDENV